MARKFSPSSPQRSTCASGVPRPQSDIVALRFQPVKHRPAPVREHFKFLRRLRHMHRHAPVLLAGQPGRRLQQRRGGGIEGVGRKPGQAALRLQALNFRRRLPQNFRRRAPAFHPRHFQERRHAQRRAGPDLRQQFRHRFDVRHRRAPRPRQHGRARQPGAGVIGVAGRRFEGEEGLDPVRELARRRQAGHAGVVQVAVGVDQTGQQNGRAQVHRAFRRSAP